MPLTQTGPTYNQINKAVLISQKPHDEWSQSKTLLTKNSTQQHFVSQLRPPFNSLKRLQEFQKEELYSGEQSQMCAQKLPQSYSVIQQTTPLLAQGEKNDELNDNDWVDLPWTNHSKMSTKLSAKLNNMQQKSLSIYDQELSMFEIPQTLRTDLKSKLTNKSTADRPVRNILRLQTRHMSEPAEVRVANQILKRQSDLKQRPLRTKLRIPSATQRNFTLQQDLQAIGAASQEPQVVQESTQKKQLPILDKFRCTITVSSKPKLTQLSLAKENRDFRAIMGHQQFQRMLDAAVTQNDRIIINRAFQQYMIQLDKKQPNEQKTEDRNKLKDQQQHFSDSSGESDNTEIPHEQSAHDLLSSDRLKNNLGKGIRKMLQKYKQLLDKEKESALYQQMFSTLDFLNLKRPNDSQKELPLSDYLDQNAISLLELSKYETREQLECTAAVQSYVKLLEGEKKVVDQQPSELVRRGFAIYPNELNLENVDPDELVVDPALMFTNYCQKQQQLRVEAGEDFSERFEFSRLSQLYNFNSTIYEEYPTSKSAMITSVNQQAELALPILAKIKDRELILNEYRLESGHFVALKAAFMIQPTMLTKISLNNCGVEEQSAESLVEALRALKQITSFQLTRGRLNLKTVQLLIPLLQQPGQIDTLVLNDIQMQPPAVDLLFQSLRSCNHLKVLKIPNFTFAEPSFKHFTDFLASSRLTELSIRNLSGIRTEIWYPFMQALSHNKTLTQVDLSCNSFIEDQRQAKTKLRNPYKIFKQMYEKFIKLGPGAKWPKNPLDQPLQTFYKNLAESPNKNSQIVGGKKVLQVPDFQPQDTQKDILERYEIYPDKREKLVTEQMIQEVLGLMRQSIKFAFAMLFQKKKEKKEAQNLNEEQVVETVPIEEEKEYTSKAALIVTEAIYKFIRRNLKLQHLDLTRCNLSQVMVGRIGLGVKCSQSMMAVHFTDNPGVTPSIKAFLQVKFKAKVPTEPTHNISNAFIEEEAGLKQTTSQQLSQMQAESSLAHEAVIIRELQNKIFDCSGRIIDHSAQETHTLVFTRLLGHKLTIPNSGRWQILTKADQECWICKHYVMSYFFWSPQVETHVHQSLNIDVARVAGQLEQVRELGPPTIFGKFTDWKARPMMRVSELAALPRTTEPCYMKMVKQKYDLGPGYDQLQDFKPEHRQLIKQMKIDYNQAPQTEWRRLIAAFIRWQKPQFINYDLLPADEDLEDLYVFQALVKPGKLYYVVQHNQLVQGDSSFSDSESNNYLSEISVERIVQSHPVDQQGLLKLAPNNRNLIKRAPEQESVSENSLNFDSDRRFYLHKAIIPMRTEQIPIYVKKMLAQEIDRQFILHKSVFAKWKPDNKKIIEKCVTNDFLAMRIQKFVPNDEVQTALFNKLAVHISFIKVIHLELLCETNMWPYISFLDFSNWYRESKLADDNLKSSSIDLVYTQVSTNDKARNGINRGEFIEAIIRIAKAKFLDTGLCKKLTEAIEKIIELVKFNYRCNDPHSTRKKLFWTTEVNDLLGINLDGLQKVYSGFYNLREVVKKRWMDIKEAEQLMTQMMPQLKVNVKTARRCFLLAKMTVEDEQNKIEQYNKLQFVEFLEMLCRVAHEHFDDRIYEEWDYMQKLRFVLDNVLALVGKERKDVVPETKVDSDADVSDCDY